MVVRKRHPSKEIEAALCYAEFLGWLVVAKGHHAWGKMYCPANLSACRCGEYCLTCIWRTPKSAQNHAKALRRVVDNCMATREWKKREGL
ncbi:hypothetical protein [Pantoea ananatis]|uniref:hypothetical protein n=1 Tax=Pantoea ananas TaxID=553 RepID=UPI000DA66900|nr:hypothetical protein [Pantoea ananatis]PZD68323.1 hypothetical protein ARC272_00195 [Pantoea ananatis]